MEKALRFMAVGAVFAVLGFAACGCVPHGTIKATVQPAEIVAVPTATQVPTAIPSPVPVPSATPEPYIIERGDTLWGLSGSLYGDPFLWPHIYRANRDYIYNPELIFEHDRLLMPSKPNLRDSENAKGMAEDYDPYPADPAKDIYPSW